MYFLSVYKRLHDKGRIKLFDIESWASRSISRGMLKPLYNTNQDVLLSSLAHHQHCLLFRHACGEYCRAASLAEDQVQWRFCQQSLVSYWGVRFRSDQGAAAFRPIIISPFPAIVGSGAQALLMHLHAK